MIHVVADIISFAHVSYGGIHISFVVFYLFDFGYRLCQAFFECSTCLLSITIGWRGNTISFAHSVEGWVPITKMVLHLLWLVDDFVFQSFFHTRTLSSPSMVGSFRDVIRLTHSFYCWIEISQMVTYSLCCTYIGCNGFGQSFSHGPASSSTLLINIWLNAIVVTHVFYGSVMITFVVCYVFHLFSFIRCKHLLGYWYAYSFEQDRYRHRYLLQWFVPTHNHQ